MRLGHSDFVSDESYGATPRPADAELRAMTAVSVLKRGLALSGTVSDMQGKPIAGASVAQGTDRFGSNQPKVKTDGEGKFAFRNSQWSGHGASLKLVEISRIPVPTKPGTRAF